MVTSILGNYVLSSVQCQLPMNVLWKEYFPFTLQGHNNLIISQWFHCSDYNVSWDLWSICVGLPSLIENNLNACTVVCDLVFSKFPAMTCKEKSMVPVSCATIQIQNGTMHLVIILANYRHTAAFLLTAFPKQLTNAVLSWHICNQVWSHLQPLYIKITGSVLPLSSPTSWASS